MSKRTCQPNKSKTMRTHGFRQRMKTPSGKSVLQRRRLTGRKKLTV